MSTITVGEILKSQRQKKKLSLSDIHKFTKINPKFLEALESGDVSVFSDQVHAKGFLKIYAEFLDLNQKEVLAFWRREFEGEFEKKEKENSFKVNLLPLETKRVFLTPSVIIGSIVLVLVLGFFGYLFFQYRAYSGAPDLDIYTPTNNQVFTYDILDITGSTEQDSALLINNQQVVINTDGSFATSLKLSEGLNTLSFESVNKIGKKTEKVITVIYRPSETERYDLEIDANVDLNDLENEDGSEREFIGEGIQGEEVTTSDEGDTNQVDQVNTDNESSVGE